MSYLIDGLKSFDFCVTPCQNDVSIEVTRERKKFPLKLFILLLIMQSQKVYK